MRLRSRHAVAPAPARLRGLVPLVITLTCLGLGAAAQGGPFDLDDRTPQKEVRVVYRLDATVLMPLVIGSIPIAHRQNVGLATFVSRDYVEAGSAHFRVLEFFAASNPERARGLNRYGLARETLRVTQQGTEQTSYFGVVSSKREQSRKEADRAIETTKTDRRQDVQPFMIIDGVIAPAEAKSTLRHVTLAGRPTGADSLYAQVQPLWKSRAPDATPIVPNPAGQTYREPLAFLGALAASLQRAASELAKGKPASQTPQRFVLGEKVYVLTPRTSAADDAAARQFLAAGLIQEKAVVRRLRYQMTDNKREDDESFDVWVAVPGPTEVTPLTAPIVPLAFQFRARSFLELRGVQVKNP